MGWKYPVILGLGLLSGCLTTDKCRMYETSDSFVMEKRLCDRVYLETRLKRNSDVREEGCWEPTSVVFK